MATAPELGSLYQAVILDHYRRPRNHGDLEDAGACIHMNNPTCGDEIRLSLRMDGERIAVIRFEGRGCSISQASASMMTELIVGETAEAADAVAARFKALLRGEEGVSADRSLGSFRALAGVAKFPARVRCALLAWNALEAAVAAGKALQASSHTGRDPGARDP